MDVLKAKLNPVIHPLLGKPMKKTEKVKVVTGFECPEIMSSDAFLKMYEFFVMKVVPRGLPGAWNGLGSQAAKHADEKVAYHCTPSGYQHVASVTVYMTDLFTFGTRDEYHHGN